MIKLFKENKKRYESNQEWKDTMRIENIKEEKIREEVIIKNELQRN